MWALRGARARVISFQWRARRLANRTDDRFSFLSATRPPDLKMLLDLARGCKRVAELGTGTGWSAICLALDDPERSVVSYDPVDRDPQRYLRLVRPEVRRRVKFVVAEGAVGPDTDEPFDLLYVDSSHEREPTIQEVKAWTPYLRPGAPVLIDDYIHADYQGVREAVEALGLVGELHGKVFVCRLAPIPASNP
jgi:predicted O-methyltransferase YrrM